MCVARDMKKWNVAETAHIVWNHEEEVRGGWKRDGHLEVSRPS